MSSYEVNYSYLNPVYDDIIVEAEANNPEAAEKAALDKLSDMLHPDIDDVMIETIRELK